MSELLERLKLKYKKAKYPPREGCRWCNGTGERWVLKGTRLTVCPCIMLDHDFVDEGMRLIAASAKKQLEQMRKP